MGVVSRRWVWVETMGVVVRRYIYRFPHTTYPYSSSICSFCNSIPTFCSFKKIFFILVPVLFCNLCNNFFTQYKHT